MMLVVTALLAFAMVSTVRYRSQQYATAIYRAFLAEKLQALGYEIRVDPRTGAPDIKGFSEEYLQDSSPRRKEVLKEEEKMKERL